MHGSEPPRSWGIGEKVVFIGVVVGILASLVTIISFINQANQAEEDRKKASQQEIERIVRDFQENELDLLVVKVRQVPGASGQLSLRNSSKKHTITVNEVRLVISDPDSLRIINKLHPKPMIGSATPSSTASSPTCYWRGNKFVFSAETQFFMQPGHPHELVLKLKDQKLAGRWFTGTLECDVDNGFGETATPKNEGVKLLILHPSSR